MVKATAGRTETGGSAVSVLKHSQFRLLFIGSALAMLGFGMMNVVQGVVAFELTGKNGAVGFVLVGQGLAMLFLSPVGGALSDRVSKRRMLLLAQSSIGISFGVIATLIALGVITIWLLALCTLFLGCMFAMMGPTRQAWIGDLLSGPDLARGVALQQLMMNATRIVGPLFAGGLLAISAVGSSGVYFAMAAIFALVVFVLALMEPTQPRPKKANSLSIAGDLKEGLGYIWTNREVRLLTLTFGGIVLSGFSYQTLLPGYLENELGHPASQIGLLFGTTAVGGIATTLVMSARPVRSADRWMTIFGGLLAASLLFLAIAPGFIAALVVSAMVGASSSGYQMLNQVALMERTAQQYFGRVMSVTMMAFGLNSVFAFPVGVLADGLGERQMLGGLAACCMTVVVAGAAARSRLDSRKAAAAAESATAQGPVATDAGRVGLPRA